MKIACIECEGRGFTFEEGGWLYIQCRREVIEARCPHCSGEGEFEAETDEESAT